MKSLFLVGAASREALVDALGQLLPGGTDPWILADEHGRPIARFHLDTAGGVEIDVSDVPEEKEGRVRLILASLQERVGGVLEGDW